LYISHYTAAMAAIDSATELPFQIWLSAEDLLTLCTITQKPCEERSLDDMLKVMAVTSRASQSLIDVARNIPHDDVTELHRRLNANKRSTLLEIEDDYSKALGEATDSKNKYDAASSTPAATSSKTDDINDLLNKFPLPPPTRAQICEHFIITIHNTYTDKYYPAKIFFSTKIITLAALLQASEGIPLQRMRLIHKDNALLIPARSKADPMQDTETFGYYNVHLGDLVSLSMITDEEHMPEAKVHVPIYRLRHRFEERGRFQR
ncbi:hypothetical protein CLAFUW4_10200, partial [Fulvia fulva]